ncbi:MotA/TolQ/ExbB proton channel family protein [Skermanella rosea]|uniref:MotA/TolQ/ExbB proton channel family protein n=1 Tax=Skermanella rosea TaxID=1817965 RepID=UPI001E38878A|nr:MotA/TolQ/ExbB proton channel family protein [Skermanella rosea]UEM02075.1 MotA/TolQ/ExbB proton channel family protein [Skermanella rosea]
MTDATAETVHTARSTVPTVLHTRSSNTIVDFVLNPQKYLLVLRFALVNTVASALLAAAWLQGWITPILDSDDTGLCQLIFAVFLVGLAVSASRVWRTSCELNACKDFQIHVNSRAARYVAEVMGRDSGSRSTLAGNLRLKLSSRVAMVRHLAASLVLLGLIGTVVGFIISLSGVDPAKAGDVASIAPMVTKLIEGMSVALYTTLVGGVLNIWLSINYNMLATGTVNLITEITALGERHAGS